MTTTPRGLAVQLVRNGVAHDARVLRAAGVLRDGGWSTVIVGSVTAATPAVDDVVQGVSVRRLRARSPVGALRRLFGGTLPAPLARLHRGLTALDWHRRAFAELHRRRPGLVHANDHNTMWTAVLAKLLLGARVVYDSHELWADRNGRPEWRPGLVATEWLFVRVADAVITASPGYAQALATRYRVPVPTVVRNIPQRASATGGTGVPSGDPAICVYVGGLMPGRGLEPAIDALVHAPDVQLRLVGRGHAAYVQGLVARARSIGVEGQLTLLGAIPPEAVVATAARGGFGLCLIEPICRSYELTLPNKLFEYAEAGLPILGSNLPVIAATVAESGIGLIVDPADIAAIAAAMRTLAAEPATGPRRTAIAAFTARMTWATEREVLAGAYRRSTPTSGS